MVFLALCFPAWDRVRVAPSAPCPQGADSPAPPGLGAGSGDGARLLLPGVLGSSAIWWGSRTWLKAAWVSTGTYQIPLQANSHHEPGRRQTQPAKMWRVCCRVSWCDMMNRRAGMMGMCWERGWRAEGVMRRRYGGDTSLSGHRRTMQHSACCPRTILRSTQLFPQSGEFLCVHKEETTPSS